MGQGALKASGSKGDHPFLGGSGPQLCSSLFPRARAVLLMQQSGKSQAFPSNKAEPELLLGKLWDFHSYQSTVSISQLQLNISGVSSREEREAGVQLRRGEVCILWISLPAQRGAGHWEQDHSSRLMSGWSLLIQRPPRNDCSTWSCIVCWAPIVPGTLAQKSPHYIVSMHLYSFSLPAAGILPRLCLQRPT